MNNTSQVKNGSAGSLLRLHFPTIVMMIFMGLYTIVDTIFVAQFVNTDAISSINTISASRNNFRSAIKSLPVIFNMSKISFRFLRCSR